MAKLAVFCFISRNYYVYIYYGSRAEGLSASNRRWKHAIDKVTELLTKTNEKFDEMSQSNE